MIGNTEFLGECVRIAISVAVLMVAWQLVYIPTMVDVFRQRVFTTRRDLFSLMAAGLIEPTHPAYVHLRRRMNGLLRFAERITFPRVILSAAMFRTRTKDYQAATNAKFEMVSDDAVKRKLIDFDNRLQEEIAWHLVKTSLICWFVVFPAFLVVSLAHRIVQIRPLVRFGPERRLIVSIEAEAECFVGRKGEMVGA